MPARARRTNSRRKVQKFSSSKLLTLFLIAAFVVLVTGSMVRAASLWNTRLWKGEERLTFVVATDPPVLVSYQTKAGELVLISFPRTLEIEASSGAGEWQIASLFELGRQQKIGGTLLAKSVQYQLQVPVDGWIEGKGITLLGYGDVEEITAGAHPLSGMRALFAAFSSIGLDTNFTFFDKVRIARTLGGMDGSHRRVINAQERRIVRSVRRADGSMGFILDKERVQELTLREFQDVLVAQERVGIGVVNTTDKAGAGGQIAAVVEGMGARIVWVRAGSGGGEHCTLRTRQETRETLTVRRLKELLGCIITGDADSAPVELVVNEGLARSLPAP